MEYLVFSWRTENVFFWIRWQASKLSKVYFDYVCFSSPQNCSTKSFRFDQRHFDITCLSSSIKYVVRFQDSRNIFDIPKTLSMNLKECFFNYVKSQNFVKYKMQNSQYATCTMQQRIVHGSNRFELCQNSADVTTLQVHCAGPFGIVVVCGESNLASVIIIISPSYTQWLFFQFDFC